MTTPKTNSLYYTPSLPSHWITREGDGLVMWPAEADGWSRRTPYRGHATALIEAPTYNAKGTGWTS